MCFIMKTEMLYTRVQCKERDSGAVFLFPCCIAAGCSPEITAKISHDCENALESLLPLITCTLTLVGAAIVGTHE